MLGSDAWTLSTVAVTAGLALAAFVSTNLDNLGALCGAFIDSRYTPRSVVLGFGIGSSTVLALSVLAALLAVAMGGSTRVLGLVPLGMGLFGVWRLRLRAGQYAAPPIGASPPRGRSPLAGPVHGHAMQLLTVAATTVACGGDNVAVYAPLLARRPQLAPLNLIILVLLNASLCLICYYTSNAAALRRWGSIIGPAILIVVAVTILSGGRGIAVPGQEVGSQPPKVQAARANWRDRNRPSRDAGSAGVPPRLSVSGLKADAIYEVPER